MQNSIDTFGNLCTKLKPSMAKLQNTRPFICILLKQKKTYCVYSLFIKALAGQVAV